MSKWKCEHCGFAGNTRSEYRCVVCLIARRPKPHEAEPLEAVLDPFGDDVGAVYPDSESHVAEEAGR